MLNIHSSYRPCAFRCPPKASGGGLPGFSGDAGLRFTSPTRASTKPPSPPARAAVLFQRPADIVVSVRDGSVDFGITGIDVIEERRGENGDLLVLHEALGFGAARCAWPCRKTGAR